MRVVYSDESEQGPITVIAALMINVDRDWMSFEGELRKIQSETPTLLLRNGREFKGSDLYGAIRKVERWKASGKTDDPDLKSLQKAEGILRRLLALTVSFAIPIFYGAADRAGCEAYAAAHPGASTAYGVAFDDCLARVNNVASTVAQDNEMILWIHDRRGREGEQETKFGLIWTRHLASMEYDPATFERTTQKIRVRIADTIYFGDSHDSLALQLADVCCYTIARHLLETLYGWELLAKPFYQIIQRGVLTDGIPPKYRE